MAKGRSKTFKYKNFKYSDDISNLLKVDLSVKDINNIEKIKNNYYDSGLVRGYEYIIHDLYILLNIHKLTTTQLAQIYLVGPRTVQIWLKELGLNRSLKAAKVANKSNSIKNSDVSINIQKDKSNNFGINCEENSSYPRYITDFLNYLETIKGKSENTVNGYKIDLILLFRFLKVYKGYFIPEGIEFEEIYIGDLDENFLKSIKLIDLYSFLSFTEKQRNNGTYARARKVATIKSFFKFLYGKAKLINENPALELESPKINKRHPIYLSLDESLDLLNSLDKKNINYYRDYCILTLFLNCGMRLSELCSIQVDKIKGDTLTIIGKGNKERTVYLNEAFIKASNDY